MFDFVSNLLPGAQKPAAAPSPGHSEGAPQQSSFLSSVTQYLPPNPFVPITGLTNTLDSNLTPKPAPGQHPDSPAPPKSTPEQTKKAEESRDALKDKVDKLALDPAKKEKILARTKGLSGDALVTEMAAIENALAGKNGDRALSAYADLQDMAAGDEKARGRLTPEMVSMLVTGVANSRTSSDRGQAGILGGKQVRDSAQALVDMSPEEFAKTQQLLDKAGTDEAGKLNPNADKAAEQALILKAVGARKDKFKHTFTGDVVDWTKELFGGETPNSKANKEIDDFAKDIRGMGRDDLIQNTTLIDVDDRNTSTFDPDNPDRKNVDTKSDNDGLYQRFDMSCGPTTAQMVRGENDPAYALKLRKNNFVDPDPNSEYAKEQKDMLEKNGGVAVSRLGEAAQTDANKKMADMAKNKELTAEQQSSINKVFSGTKLEGDDAKKSQEALDALRKKNDGHPTDLEIKAIQDNAGKTGVGMTLDPALSGIAGVDMTHNNATMSAAQMTNVDNKLKDGQQVPIRVAGGNTTGHFMMVSDVRGKPGSRQYLVSDPLSGATRWVAEGDLGGMKNFGSIGNAGVTHFYGDKNQSI